MLVNKINQKKNLKSAFSLIELSIVLIIIGLLVAGVTAGKSLIVSARITAAKALTESSPVTSIKGLTLWLDAMSDASFEDPEDIEHGDDVAVWKDVNPQSSKINFESGSANPPSYNVDAINSLPAISFNADDENEDEILISNSGYTDLSNTSFTLFVVAKHKTGTSGIATILHQEDATDGAAILQKNSSTDEDVISTAIGEAVSGEAVSFSPEIYTIRYKESGALEIYTNGRVSDGTENSNHDMSSLTAGSTKWRIGSDANNANRFFGDIGEIIFFDRRLRKSEIRDVVSYLSQKWKIDITEPY